MHKRPKRRRRSLPVLRALLSLLQLSSVELSCLAEGELSSSRYWICAKSAQCGLIPEAGDCLAGARISGADAVELFRRTLDLLGSR